MTIVLKLTGKRFPYTLKCDRFVQVLHTGPLWQPFLPDMGPTQQLLKPPPPGCQPQPS